MDIYMDFVGILLRSLVCGVIGGLFGSLMVIIIIKRKTKVEYFEEAGEDDIGKLCLFSDFKEGNEDYEYRIGVLDGISSKKANLYPFRTESGSYYEHCRRLTEEEIKKYT